MNTPRTKLPVAKLRELAVRASCDPRVIAAVLLEPETATRNLARQRAAAVLAADGFIPSAT